MATTRISDIVVPEIYDGYLQERTMELTAIIQSGLMVPEPLLDAKLAGGGLTFNAPYFQDLANDGDDIGNDDPSSTSTPGKVGASQEISVRMHRNKSWSSMALTAFLAGADPMQSILDGTALWWARRLQMTAISVIMGVYANNESSSLTGDSLHTQNDMTYDISGSAYDKGVTTFSAEAFNTAIATMGDAALNQLGTLMVHSVVLLTMQNNNLIDFIKDSESNLNIPVFAGFRVVVDDNLPNPAGTANINTTSSGIYHSWIFGPGALRFGSTPADVPSEIERTPAAGNGSGQETLFTRNIWAIHPPGYKWDASSTANGGPGTTDTTNNLGHADSWSRVAAERKMVRMARLISRES